VACADLATKCFPLNSLSYLGRLAIAASTHCGEPVADYIAGIAGTYGASLAVEVRVSPVAPSVDCRKVKVASVEIWTRESARDQVRQERIEFGKRFAEPLGCAVGRNVAGLNAEAHSPTAYVPRSGKLSTLTSSSRTSQATRRAPTIFGFGILPSLIMESNVPGERLT
jgi:hypothetical protein